MGRNNDDRFIEFTEGIPIGFAYYDDSYIYAIEKENSLVYIRYILSATNSRIWYIGCYIKIPYKSDTMIKIIVFYI